jgi:zinc transport system substrate-binding protein
MKRVMAFLLVLFLIIPISSCSKKSDGKPIVAAGIVPVASFIEMIAGDLVEVVTLIPPGNSPANYQPSSKEMQALSDSVIYFTMQMPTEEANILPKVSNFNKDIIIVNLRDVVSAEMPLRMIEEHHHDGDEHEDDEDDDDELSVDPHLWLDPLNARLMLEAIADELIKQFPEHEGIFQTNKSLYSGQLFSLYEEIDERMEKLEAKSFMIYHGAYGYFADRFGLEMISIEVAGKQATAAEIQEVIEHANEEGIKVVFYQDEFDDNQAQTVAEEINGRVEKASPLSPDYVESLLAFAEALEKAQD